MWNETVTRRALLAGSAVAASGVAFAGRIRGRRHVEASVAAPMLEFGTAQAVEKPVRVDPPDGPTPWTRGVIGNSVLGVPIERWDIRPPSPDRHVVLVCGVHGDERANDDFADLCTRIEVPEGMHYTVIPMLNPDGWAVSERNNANDVDLNRNFPWGWNPFTPFSGEEAASEPETQAIIQFLEIKRPNLVVWFHQPLDYVAALAGCPPEYAELWSQVAGVRNRLNVAQVGGGESWAANELEVPSMLIEVGGTRTDPIGVERHVQALEALLAIVR